MGFCLVAISFWCLFRVSGLFAMQIQPLTNPELPNFDLVPLKSEDKPYRSYQLPGESWGLAYEPEIGRAHV